MVSDRASNYFVSGEDYIKPGSIPGNTIIIIRRADFTNTVELN
jgi:hypothetical protein